MRQRLSVLVFLLLFIIVFAANGYGATYNSLIFSNNSTLTAGNYIITGDFIVNEGVTLKAYEDTQIIVKEGDAKIYGNIVIYGSDGDPGSDGLKGQNGSVGGNGTTCNFNLIANKGNILVNGYILNQGGKGGSGGRGGDTKSGTDAGDGGQGGKGGDGGQITIIAEQGKIEINNLLKSIGGKGGKGGNGGDDVTAGFLSDGPTPGNGATGGSGGNGGTITIVGQDVYLSTNTAFNVTPGLGGDKGYGGDSGSLGSDGSDGEPGNSGQPGKVIIEGGEVFYDSSRISSKNELGNLNFEPSFSQLTTFQRDYTAPDNSDAVQFPEGYYQHPDTNVVYTANSSPVVKVKVPEDKGFWHDSIEYLSGLSNFKVYSDENYIDWGIIKIPSASGSLLYDPTKVDNGYFSIPLSLKSSGYNTNLHLNVVTYDRYGNKNEKISSEFGGLVLYVDTMPPGRPEITNSQVNGNNAEFWWESPGDSGSGVKDYDLEINGQIVANNTKDTHYVYTGQYNQKVECKVYARDNVGNLSSASEVKTVYTAPQSTAINYYYFSGNAFSSTGYSVYLRYISVGSKAAKYRFKYYEVDQNGNRLFDESFDVIHEVTSNPLDEGKYIWKSFNYLKPHKWYMLAVQTVNQDGSKKSDWIYYGPVQIENIPPTAVELISPVSEEYLNVNNADDFTFRAETSSDGDGDRLNYNFIFENLDAQGQTPISIPGLVVDGEVTLDSLDLIDGTYQWYVTVDDNFIREPVESEKRILYVDRTRPLVGEFTVAKTEVNDNEILLTNITVHNNDVNRLKIWSKGYSDSVVKPYLKDIVEENGSYSYTFSLPVVEGEQTICLKTIDKAGNESEISYEKKVIYDLTAPEKPASLTLSGDINSIKVSWEPAVDRPATTGIAASGIDYYLVEYKKYGSKTWSNPVKLNTTSYTIQNVQDNERYQVRIIAYDKAGNASTAVIGDGYAKPAVGSFSYTTDYEYTETGYQHFIRFTIDPGNFTKYRIKRVDTQTNPAWIDSTTLTYRENCLPHGVYSYIIETANPDNETRQSDIYTIVIPNHLPQVPECTVTGFVNQLQPVLECEEAVDVDGDALTYYYYLEEVDQAGNRTPVVEWEEANTSDRFYQVPFNLKDGYTYFYQVAVEDGILMENGVFDVVSNEAEFVVDITPPVVELNLPETIKDKVLNDEFVKEASVTVMAWDKNSVSEDGPASGLGKLYYYWNEDKSEPIFISPGTTIEVFHGINTLYVVAEDNQGNVSEPVSLTFKVDTTGPVVSDLALEGTELAGIKYTVSSSELFARFKLKEEETEVVQGFYTVISASDYPYLDSIAIDSWLPLEIKKGIDKNYGILIPFDLVDGEKYYFVLKAANPVGIETEVISEPIKVDCKPPVISFTDNSGDIPDQYKLKDIGQLTLTAEVFDSGSGVDRVEHALSNNPDPFAVVNWYPDLNNLSGVETKDGEKYYLLVKAVDKLGQEDVKVSVPLLIDATPPVFVELIGGDPIPGTDNYQTQWDPTYLNVYWQIFDETRLTDLKYAIGTTTGGREVSKELPGNEDGWLNLTGWSREMDYTIENLNLKTGTYYVTIAAFNEVGLMQTATTNPIRIDTTKPPQPQVKDDGFSTCRKEIHFTVSYPAEELKSKTYYYRILDSTASVIYGEKPILNPNNLPDVSITVDESMGINLEIGQIYYVVIGELQDGKFLPVSYTDGISIDTTPPEFITFNDGTYFTSDNVYLSWEAKDPESKISRYYLKIGTTWRGDELTGGWIDLGNQTSAAVRDLNFEDGGLYFAAVKAVNRAGLTEEIYGDGFRIDDTPPPVPKVLRECEYTNRLDRLSASWTWTEPDTGSGTAAYYYDYLTVRDVTRAEWKPVEGITNNPLSTSLELNNLNLVNGQTYYIAIKAVDKAGLESVGLSQGIMADTDAPTPPIIDDLRDYQDFTDRLTAHFYSRDAHSGIKEFKFAIGTLEDKTAVLDWTLSANSEETIPNLNLKEGEVYFFTALATDNAGLKSATSRSNGVLIDLEKPAVTALKSEGEYTGNGEELFFSWEGVPSHAPIVRYEYYLTTEANPTSYNWKSTEQEQTLLKAVEEVGSDYFENGKTYYLFVRAEDASGKVSDIVSAHIKIDATPPQKPEIIQQNEYQSQNLTLTFKSTDPETGIAKYRYGIGTVKGKVDLTGGWVTVEKSDDIVTVKRNDLPVKHNHRYYLAVQAQNNAGAYSEVGTNDGFLIDLTPPSMPTVTGPGEYINSDTTIEDIMFTSKDEEVGIESYRYQIVPLDQKDAVKTLIGNEVSITPQGENYDKSVEIEFTADNLKLEENASYYVAVQVKNILNLWSDVGFSSKPFIVDTTPPEVTFLKGNEEIVTNGESILVSLMPNEPGQAYYCIKHPDGTITPENGYNIIEITDIKEYQIPFKETEYGTYQINLYMIDLAGNKSEMVVQNIRVNRPPEINVGLQKTQYKGRELKFNDTDFSIIDYDGQVVRYDWDFGDGTEVVTTTQLDAAHAYTNLGDYQVKLTVTDNDHGVSTAFLDVTITNTLEGVLVLDETWKDTINLKGDIIIPEGVTLTIEPGTKIIVPLDKGFEVHGTLICNGYLSSPVIFTTYNPDGAYTANLWKGIYLSETSIGSQFYNTIVEYARRGLTLNLQYILIEDSSFIENGIGIHLANSEVVISDCRFEDNLYYGIKEEGVNTPILTNNIFSGSGLAPYYHHLHTLLTVDEINQIITGSGNNGGDQ